MKTNYITIKQAISNETIIQKSRFICYLQRTETEEQAQEFITSIKNQHKGANHNCSAYVIGDQNQIQKANDDGEPSGTAGVPMLEVLKKQQLRNVTAVVTRYFGGIKLGGGGLIRAYGSAVSDAIKVSGRVECVKHIRYHVKMEYHLLGKVENTLRSSVYLLDEIRYTDNVELLIDVRAEQSQEFEEWMTALTSAQATCTVQYEHFIEMDC